MEYNSEHRNNPLKKFTPQVKKFSTKKIENKKAWWDLKDDSPTPNIKLPQKEMSLTQKILLDEKIKKIQENSCVDTAIQEYGVDFSANGKIMLKYMEKYLAKEHSLYQKMKTLEKSDIRNEFCEYEWTLLIEQAWVLAYKKAMDDEYITLEERHELNNLYSLAKRYKGALLQQPQMRQKLKDSFKVLNAIDNKYAIENRYEEGELWMKQYDSVPKQTRHYKRLPNPRPKLTPYSDGHNGYR